MRARIAIVLLVASVLTFLQSVGGAACAYPGTALSSSGGCCCAEASAVCVGMSCEAPESGAETVPLDLFAGVPSLDAPVPRVVDAPDFERFQTPPRGFAPAPLALASHPPPLAVSCILLI